MQSFPMRGRLTEGFCLIKVGAGGGVPLDGALGGSLLKLH